MNVEVRSNDPSIIKAAQDLRESKNLIELARTTEESARKTLLKYMQALGAQKLVAGTNTVILVEYQRTSVDSLELRKMYPEIHRQCSHTVTVRSLRIKDV